MGLVRMGLPRFALLVLSLFFLSWSSHLSPARPPGPVTPQAVPGQVREVIAPATTVVETVHYQAELFLACSGDACTGDFPPPGRNRRLNVTRMSCWVYSVSSAGMTFRYGYIALLNTNGSAVLYQFLPADHFAPNDVMLNRAVDVQVAAGQHLWAVLAVTGGAAGASCTATGTLDTLQ
jgi:hypothetical protein